jgi:hypothetical protein
MLTAFRNAAWLSLVTLCLLLPQCGQELTNNGGTDTGNPIHGTVTMSNGSPASNTTVLLGSTDPDSVLDSAITDSKGDFAFRNVAAGSYVLTAQKNSQLGIANVSMASSGGADVDILLNAPISITLYIDSLSDTLDITGAKIAGTRFLFSGDTGANLVLSSAPAGDMLPIVLTGRTGMRYQYAMLKPDAGSKAYIIVDASKPPEQWISGGYGPRTALDTPFVVWASPPPGATGAFARLNRHTEYEMAIQFSLPMNTRLTRQAINVSSSDGSAAIDTITWQGADVVYIRFKRLPSLYGIAQTGYGYPFRVGVRYRVTISANAQSIFGIPFAAAETLWIMPEPFPRMTLVYGFRHKALASHEVWDSLPPVITLGDSVSPSIALLDGNTVKMDVVGMPLESTFTKGIRCYEDTTLLAQSVAYSALYYNGTISIMFKNLLKSNTRYTLKVDTSLQFNAGKLPMGQAITWKTSKFTIDTALVLGSYFYSAAIPLISTNGMYLYTASNYPEAVLANLPFTTFYASTVLDSASVRPNIMCPPYFSKDSVIIEGNKFGWKANRWLPSNTPFEFVIMPGLASKAGDTLGDTLRFHVATERFSIRQFHVFNLQPLYSGYGYYENPPVQDSLYPLPLGTLTYSNRRFDYVINPYSAFVVHNAPVKKASAAAAFRISPDNGFTALPSVTGLQYSASQMLIPDTTYTVRLDSGIADTFGSTSSYSFTYRFKTEKFGLKIGNLFGLYFGYPQQQEIKNLLPGQVLPEIQIIDQGVLPGEPVIWTMGSTANFIRPLSTADSLGIYSTVRISNQDGVVPVYRTPIGLPRSYFVPGFSDTMNYLCFSGIPDSNDYKKFVQLTPNDGSIALKLEANKLRFSTSAYSKPSTVYRIKIDKGFHDLYGRTFGDSLAVSFTTPPFTLVNGWAGSNVLSRDSILAGRPLRPQPTAGFSFGARFSYPLLLSSVESNVIVEPPVKGRINAAADNLSFTCSQVLIPDTTYRITIKNGLKETNATMLDTSFSLVFATEKFKLQGLSIGFLEGKQLFYLYTNSLIDTGACRKAVSISPARYAAGKFELSGDSTAAYFLPDSGLQLGDDIFIRVDSTMADRFGNTLGKQDSLEFVITTKNW